LEQAKALLASAKLAKAQEKQYESLGKAIGELVAHMEAVGKEADVINQIYRMFVPYNQKLADLFNETAKNSFNAARAMEGSAAAQRQLASDTSKANQTLREQNQLLNGQNTPPAPVSKPKPKKDTEQKPTPVSSPAPQVDDAAQSAERLSDAAQDATHSVRTLTDELSKPATSSPAAMAAPVEEVKEQAQKAKKEVLSLGKEIKGIGKKTYNDKELSGLDKSLEQTYASIYGSKGVEKVTKLNYEDVDRSLDSVKKRYEDFFSDIFQMFRNKNLGELGSSISKLMSQTNFENDRYGKAKDWRRELFEGVDPKTFDDYLSKILDGTVSADAVKAFKKRILQIVENANKMRDEIEKNLGESYAAVEEYRSKVKPTKPTEEVKPSEEKKKQNIAIQHLESILKLRKEIASAGNASKPPEEKELQLYEYLANSLILAKRNGDTTFIDEARAKYKALFDEFENAKGIPPLLNLIMDGVDGAENFISGRRVAKAGGRNDKEQREQVTPKKQSSAEAATEHAAALIKKMQQLKDLIQSMGEIPVGTLDYSRAEGQVKQLEAEIRGHYSTLQNQIEGSEEKTKALAAVEINRASILEELT